MKLRAAFTSERARRAAPTKGCPRCRPCGLTRKRWRPNSRRPQNTRPTSWACPWTWRPRWTPWISSKRTPNLRPNVACSSLSFLILRLGACARDAN
ncbi:hypothetical protein BCR44DRAFT_353888 [Catenaria anguillulae PL171]|uniref:Uncharacterized protein n=1 Tax=Catenaria anguillulae PL171 TaxID=765915 RepID=A0A1Y2HDY5_9FUNG|nr:hypothetical protein BCR44DRAFT_353888 [Catenaria anguillulae PL171]